MEILKKQNYIEMIKKSVGDTKFRSLFVLENGEKKDILNDGDLSCAYFVSSILKIYDLVSTIHATVDGLVGDMQKNDWAEAKTPNEGDVLVWEEKNGHKHIGFYVGNNEAISNSDKERAIVKHHYTYNNTRKIIQILTRDKF